MSDLSFEATEHILRVGNPELAVVHYGRLRQHPSDYARLLCKDGQNVGAAWYLAVVPWLSDPSQATTTTSWLNSPAVMFIGLIGAVVSIIQAVVAVGKWTKEVAGKEGARRRLTITFATACLAANAIVAPVTWTTVIAADKGDSHWVADLYPVMTCLMVLAGSFWVLLLTSRRSAGRPSCPASS